MLLPRHSFSALKLVVPLILLFGTAFYLFQSPDQIEVPDYNYLYKVAVSGKKAAFVDQFLSAEIDGPYDGEPLRAFCANRTWTPGLIAKCEALPGGVGNVRNMMLNCFRFALEAGATGLIVPEIIVRGEDLSNLRTNVLTHFSHFFDYDHFTSSLTTFCPQIQLYPSQNDLYDVPSTAKEIQCVPYQIPTVSLQPVATTLIEDAGSWSSAFHSWLSSVAPPFSPERPVLVTFTVSLLRFPMDYDPPAFIATFGRILSSRQDLRKLAGTVLYALSTKYNLRLDCSKSKIQEGKFYGAHLRTAKDAAAVGWPGYDMQAGNYLSSASKHNLSLIYLTTGNPVDVVRFTETAANMSMEVATKSDLLAGEEFEEERRQIEELTWDQRGMVDYEVLMRSSKFGGMFESSFSWNLALKRHVLMGKGIWESIRQGKQGVGDGKGPEAFIDTFSEIFGPVALGIRWQFALGLWP